MQKIIKETKCDAVKLKNINQIKVLIKNRSSNGHLGFLPQTNEVNLNQKEGQTKKN